MNNIIFINIFRFFFLVFFQVLILNNIQLSGYINPYLYVLFILLLPFETPKWLLLFSAFTIGLCVDMFSETLGMHAAASVLMAFCRPFVLKISSSRQEYEPGIKPIIRDVGFNWVFYYSLVLITIHHIALFYIEMFSFYEFFSTLLRAVLSIIFTLLLVIVSHYLIYKPEK